MSIAKLSRAGAGLGAVGLWLIAVSAFTGCQPPVRVDNARLQGDHYLRHNLKFKQSGTTRVGYRSNYLAYPHVVKFGTKVNFTMYSAEYVDMLVDGIPFRWYHMYAPFPTDGPGIDKFMDKHFATSPGDVTNLNISESSRSSVEAGEPAINMTKEEVLLAIGYPTHVDNDVDASGMTREEVLKSNQWIYVYQEIMWIPWKWIVQFTSKDQASRTEDRVTTVIR